MNVNPIRSELELGTYIINECNNWDSRTLHSAIEVLKPQISSETAAAVPHSFSLNRSFEPRVNTLFQKIFNVESPDENPENLVRFVREKLLELAKSKTFDSFQDVCLRGDLNDVKSWSIGSVHPDLLEEGLDIALTREDLSIASYIFDRVKRLSFGKLIEISDIVVERREISFFKKLLNENDIVLNTILWRGCERNGRSDLIQVFKEHGVCISSEVPFLTIFLEKGDECFVEDILNDYADLSSRGSSFALSNEYEIDFFGPYENKNRDWKKLLKLIPLISKEGLYISTEFKELLISIASKYEENSLLAAALHFDSTLITRRTKPLLPMIKIYRIDEASKKKAWVSLELLLENGEEIPHENRQLEFDLAARLPSGDYGDKLIALLNQHDIVYRHDLSDRITFLISAYIFFLLLLKIATFFGDEDFKELILADE